MDEPLSFESLLRGANKFAWTALEAHSEEQKDVFLLHAGVSIERLAKAALARKSPFLLMEMKGKDDTLFHLAGVRQTAKLRTVGAGQAIGRLRDMAVLPQRDPDLDELIELRNGVAHLTASSNEAFDGLAVFCRVTNVLLEHLGQGQEPYWGAWSTLVDITLSDLHEKVEREVARRIEQKRQVFDKRFHGLPQEAVDSYVETLPQLGYGLQFNEKNANPKIFLPWECPACENLALITAGPPVLIRRGEPGESIPEGLICFVCQFSLNNHNEVQAAGVPHSVPLVDEFGARLLTETEEFLWHLDPTGVEIVDEN